MGHDGTRGGSVKFIKRLGCVMVDAKVDHRADGLCYVSVPYAGKVRSGYVTVRAVDEDTAVREALLAAGYGLPNHEVTP